MELLSRPSLRLVDGAYWGISLCAAASLPAKDLIFMTVVCLACHGMASLLRRSGDRRERHLQIQTYLSVACTFLSAMVLEYPSVVSALWRKNPSIDNNSNINSLENDSETVACLVSLAGLVFGHIYSVFFCEPPSRKSWAVTEDWMTAVLLLAFVVHSRRAGWEVAETMECSNSASFTYLRIWLLYKVLRPRLLPGWNKEESPDSGLANNKASIPTSGQRSSTLLSDKIMKKSQLEQSAATVTDTSMLWQVGGLYYDLADFVNRHPGGKEALLLGRGRDCTALVMSYHPFSQQQCHNILQKYQRFPTPANVASGSNNSADAYSDFFYDVLCERVAKTLNKKGIDPIEDRGATLFRSLYYVAIATFVVVSGFYHAKGSILGSFFFGAFGWLIGALGHDAGHFSASRKAWVNDLGVWGMFLLCNPIVWQHQHTYAHHSFTNDFDHDPDLHHFDNLVRVHRRFKHYPVYKNQKNCWFVVLAYAFVVFGTCFWIPLGMLRDGSLYGIVEWTDRKRPLRAAGMFLHLIGYASFIMVLPFWTLPWYKALAAAVVHLATSGLSFAFFSQINHLNEASLADGATKAKRAASRDPRLAKSWAVEQIETSNNFCKGSFAWHIVSNGLNLQIEHHLFPGLNHCHLHHIAPVVQETCLEYGVFYKEYSGWSDIVQATLTWLDTLADEPDQ